MTTGGTLRRIFARRSSRLHRMMLMVMRCGVCGRKLADGWPRAEFGRQEVGRQGIRGLRRREQGGPAWLKRFRPLALMKKGSPTNESHDCTYGLHRAGYRQG